jgi:hypothetical protein
MIYNHTLLSHKNSSKHKSLSRHNSRDFNNENVKELRYKKSDFAYNKDKPEEMIQLYPKKRKSSMNNILPNFNFGDVKDTLENIEEGMESYFSENKTKFIDRLTKGPPESFRWSAYMVSLTIPLTRSTFLYDRLLNIDLPDKVDIQIKKDLNRTLSDEPSFSMTETQACLYRLLKAFANLDPEVAYCQGMNFIFGFLLLLSDFKETDTLYLIMALFSSTFTNKFNLRGFYLNNFPLLKLYLKIFDYYFERRIPNLKKHFTDLDIPDEIWVAKWFQTLYTINLPLNVVVRLWDCLIAYGLPFIINFTLALLKNLEEDLLKATDTIDVVEYFKIMISVDTNNIKLNVEDILTQAKKYHIRFDELRNRFINEYKNLNVNDMKYNIIDVIDEGNYIESVIYSQGNIYLNFSRGNKGYEF